MPVFFHLSPSLTIHVEPEESIGGSRTGAGFPPHPVLVECRVVGAAQDHTRRQLVSVQVACVHNRGCGTGCACLPPAGVERLPRLLPLLLPWSTAQRLSKSSFPSCLSPVLVATARGWLKLPTATHTCPGCYCLPPILMLPIPTHLFLWAGRSARSSRS